MKTSSHLCLEIVCSTLLLLGLAVESAVAEVDWIFDAASCEALEQGIERHFSRDAQSNMNEQKRAELRILLFEGCGPRFADCKLSVCRAASRLEQDEQRPLFWLRSLKNCEEFRAQFKERYAFLKSGDSLAPDVRVEVDYVLRHACRIADGSCGFQNCPDTQSVASRLEERAKQAELAEFSAAMENYDRLVAEHLLARAAAVEIQIAQEKENSLAWKTAANPVELETLRERRKNERREEQRQDFRGTSPAPRPSRLAPRTQPTPLRRVPRNPSGGGKSSQGGALIY